MPADKLRDALARREAHTQAQRDEAVRIAAEREAEAAAAPVVEPEPEPSPDARL